MRKIIIEVETDSDDSIGEIQRNVEMELSCCSTPFYFDTLEVYEQADTPQTDCIDQAKADIAKRSSWSKTYEAMCKPQTERIE